MTRATLFAVTRRAPTARTCAPRTSVLPRRNLLARRGTTAVLAMLYLVIFSALAIGFYSAVTTASQIAANDERSTAARLATESGLQYVRYQLSQVKYPSNIDPEKILEEVWMQLVIQTQGAANLGGRPITMSGGTIYFPLSSSTDDYYIPLDAKGGEFRATITDLGNTVYNKDGRPPRTVRLFKIRGGPALPVVLVGDVYRHLVFVQQTDDLG